MKVKLYFDKKNVAWDSWIGHIIHEWKYLFIHGSKSTHGWHATYIRGISQCLIEREREREREGERLLYNSQLE